MRKRCYWSILLFFLFSGKVFCQAYLTKAGFIGFYSKTPFEDIQAENNQVYAILDAAGHHLAFAVY